MQVPRFTAKTLEIAILLSRGAYELTLSPESVTTPSVNLRYLICQMIFQVQSQSLEYWFKHENS